MIDSRALAMVVVLAAAGAGTRSAAAQAVGVAASRWLSTPHVSDYRLSVSRLVLGPISLTPFAQLAVQGPRSDPATLLGGGADVLLRLPGGVRPYLVAGMSGGFLDFERSLGVGLWGSWSAGIGSEVVRTSLLSFSVEARYQSLTRGETRGVSIGARIGTPLGGGRPRPAPVIGSAERGRETRASAAPPSGLAGLPADHAARLRDVAAAAREAMGAPYRWGGTDANGFDCSGLIQHAYAQIGVAVPRRSVEQAATGMPVTPSVETLVVGDILVFAAAPGSTAASHVGLYIGAGQFIHSASAGVRISRLAADDPDGRWWVERWIGARRVL